MRSSLEGLWCLCGADVSALTPGQSAHPSLQLCRTSDSELNCGTAVAKLHPFEVGVCAVLFELLQMHSTLPAK